MPNCVLATRLPAQFKRKSSNASFVTMSDMCAPDITYHSIEEGKRPELVPFNENVASAKIWSIRDGNQMVTFNNMAPNGIQDFSKDGRYCIDGYLQVFCMRSGRLVTDLGKGTETVHKLVRLTYDGQYAVWASEDNCFIKAARVTDGRPMGYICTHEKPVTLEILDFGYLIIVGRQDGVLITIKLVEGQGYIQGQFTGHATRKQRASTLLQCIYPDGMIKTFDINDRHRVTPITDESVPKIPKDIQAHLLEKARVPHAVIKTSSAGDLTGMEKQMPKRGSSPHLFKSKETSPASSGPNSPATLPRFFKPKTSPFDSPQNSANGSLPVSFIVGALGGKQKQKEKTGSYTDLRTPQKALQNIGSAILTVTDISPNRSGLNVPTKPQRKSDSGLSPYNGGNSRLVPTVADVSSDSNTSASSSPYGSLVRQKKKKKCKPRRKSDESQGSVSEFGEYGTMEYRRVVGRSRFFSSHEVDVEDENKNMKQG